VQSQLPYYITWRKKSQEPKNKFDKISRCVIV